MPTFGLQIYQTYSDFQEVEAETLQEAIDKINNGEVELDLQPVKGLEIYGEEVEG